MILSIPLEHVLASLQPEFGICMAIALPHPFAKFLLISQRATTGFLYSIMILVILMTKRVWPVVVPQAAGLKLMKGESTVKQAWSLEWNCWFDADADVPCAVLTWQSEGCDNYGQNVVHTGRMSLAIDELSRMKDLSVFRELPGSIQEDVYAAVEHVTRTCKQAHAAAFHHSWASFPPASPHPAEGRQRVS